MVGVLLTALGRWQALDKGEVRPTPAFRLLRVGADSYVIEALNTALSGEYCILELRTRIGCSLLSFATFRQYLPQLRVKSSQGQSVENWRRYESLAADRAARSIHLARLHTA